MAREIFDRQVKLSLPGLVPECQPHLVNLDVTDITQYSKYQWKKIVKNYIQNENRCELLHNIRNYKKLDYD